MPHFSSRDGRCCVNVITGPHHVHLGLTFADAPRDAVLVKEPPIGSCTHEPIDEKLLLEAVVRGVSGAAARRRRPLYPAEVAYVTNDTPRYDLYENCARLITERFLEGTPFDEAAPG
jgi:hypothetical protein